MVAEILLVKEAGMACLLLDDMGEFYSEETV